jgi:hypothetical protein
MLILLADATEIELVAQGHEELREMFTVAVAAEEELRTRPSGRVCDISKVVKFKQKERENEIWEDVNSINYIAVLLCRLILPN